MRRQAWALTLALVLAPGTLRAQDRRRPEVPGPAARCSVVLGRPTDRSITLSLLATGAGQASVAWGLRPERLDHRSPNQPLKPGHPSEFSLDGLQPDTRYHYQVTVDGQVRCEGSFHTQRAPGRTFTFALQGDSHPERVGKMHDPDLYARTLANVVQDRPDFYVTLGDDFSIERLIERQELSQASVDRVYAHQRGFLGLVGATAPLFLVNGNHEQAARYLLDGTEANAAVLAGRARLRHFPLPAPDGFYTGDAEPVAPVGLLRDYYAWTWGDALFVVLDPYWHSPVPVDNRAGDRGPDRGSGREGAGDAPAPGPRAGKGGRDLWQVTLGEAQYRWLERTLATSRARWKFVFAHHVNGTGRGGVELASLYEWGGRDRRGQDQFKERRPGWARPIHALLAQTGVTIFFQGHDHLYARQELDGVVYQSTPNPADPTYQAFNREAYRTGVLLPNSGHLRVMVSPSEVKVDYVRAYRPEDEGPEARNGSVAHHYEIHAPVGGPR